MKGKRKGGRVCGKGIIIARRTVHGCRETILGGNSIHTTTTLIHAAISLCSAAMHQKEVWRIERVHVAKKQKSLRGKETTILGEELELWDLTNHVPMLLCSSQ